MEGLDDHVHLDGALQDRAAVRAGDEREHHGAEERGARRAAGRARKPVQRGDDAQALAAGDGLDRNLYGRHDAAEAEAAEEAERDNERLVRGQHAEEEKRRGGGAHADYRDPAWPAGAAQRLRGDHRRGHHAARDRQQQHARVLRAHVMADLQVDRQEEDHREEARGEERHRDGGDGDGALAQQIDRQERGRMAPLVPHQRAERDRRRGDEREARARGPGEAMAHGGEPVERAHRADREEHVSRQVGLRLPRCVRHAARQLSQAPRREDGERHVGEEEPAPARMRDDDAADHRPGDARGGEHGGEVGLEARALARRHELADQRLGEHHQPAAAESLQHARGDELRQRLRGAAGDRADSEHAERREQHLAPPAQVAHAAVHRHDARGGEEIADRDPRSVAQAAERRRDRRRRGGE